MKGGRSSDKQAGLCTQNTDTDGAQQAVVRMRMHLLPPESQCERRGARRHATACREYKRVKLVGAYGAVLVGLASSRVDKRSVMKR